MSNNFTDRINGVLSSLAVKAPCLYATTANISLSGLGTRAGGPWASSLTAGMRILAMNQDDATENGIYNADSSDWERASDFDGNRDVAKGTIVIDSYTGKPYIVTTADPVVIGTSSISFELSTFSVSVVVSVKDAPFNASGDGSALDTSPIDSAIAAIEELAGSPKFGGGIVYFPSGRYRYDGDGTIDKSNIKFVGDNAKTSVILCESAGVSFTYSDPSNLDVSLGRFACEDISFWANSAGAIATGTGVSCTNMFSSSWKNVEFYYFFANLKLFNCYSNVFQTNHHFTSPTAITLDAACVGNQFIGGTIRLSSVNDAGYTTTFKGIDIEPMWDGKTCIFGNGASVQWCYFEPVTTLAFPFVQIGNDSCFENNLIAWSVSTRPDTFLINVVGSRNKIRHNSHSYLDRVFKFATTSYNNELEIDFAHLPVASGIEMYASYPVLDLGFANRITWSSRNGSRAWTEGNYDNLTTVEGNRKWLNFCRAPADHNLSNLTSAASTVIADPFGGSNVFLDTISGGTNGTFTYTPKSYEADGALFWTSSIWVYFPTGTTITSIMATSGGYGVGRYLSVSDLPKDRWIQLIQCSQPVAGEDIYPGFLTVGPIGGTMYHSYHTLYEGQNPGVPCGNSIFNNYSNKRISWEGAWRTPTFDAANYTASTGSCTVASGDVTAFRYKIQDNTMLINLRIDTFSLSAACANVRILLPESRKAKGESLFPCSVAQGGVWATGFASTGAGGTQIICYVDPASATGWSSGTNDKTLSLQMIVELAP